MELKNTIDIKKELKKVSNKDYAEKLQRFFKTREGEYGEGDIFIGVRVPDIRKIVNKHWKEISLKQVSEFLKSKIHEERMFALLVLIKKFENGFENEKKIIFDLYINNKNINNWDLVDISAGKIF